MKAVTLIAVIIVLITAWTVTVAAPRSTWSPRQSDHEPDATAWVEAARARDFIAGVNPYLSGHEVDKLLASFLAASREHRVDLDLLLSVAAAESHFRADVVSTRGCIGVMQVKPSTATILGAEPAKLTDPAVNIFVGAKYLRILLDRFDEVELAVSAYNAGPGRVKDRVPSIAETRQYVARVAAHREVLRRGM